MDSSAVTPDGTGAPEAFCARVDQWRQYMDTPLGRMRHGVVLANVLDQIGSRAGLRVLDAGSGSGEFALELAARGHHVCLLDSAASMLDMARRRLVQVDVALLEQAELCCCPVEQVGERFPAGHFGAVLAHTLLEYVPKPWKVLSGLIWVLARDGILSLLVVNPHAEPFRLAWAKRNPTRARDALSTMSSQADLFGVPRRILPLEQVREALQASSVQLVAERGVRIFSDYADPEDIAEPQYFEALKDLELAAGGLEPYRRVGRYTHILGVKTG